ncbi:hypothetical protein DesfrDRAFT_0132 [Solidesulfovibrio fructosivorans JJ]]|uniref:Uncharacterized protein n=1 Tax=Solidesulfovibrio fructosivorans JJ] TaxID=596151 RepID=E1JR83_SOLFR|nr:hypothetical protein [Solidesulfovibrio fructosivorans]EFL53084.1 hypothetical protein DesfrDRAFT_0132 [Solidesulfovibrio fructosivorans JJ]]
MAVRIPKDLIADCAAVAKEWGIRDMPGLESRMGDILQEAVKRRARFIQEVIDATPKGKLILKAAARGVWVGCKTREAMDFCPDQTA